jgi:hypothetical protein
MRSTASGGGVSPLLAPIAPLAIQTTGGLRPPLAIAHYSLLLCHCFPLIALS